MRRAALLAFAAIVAFPAPGMAQHSEHARHVNEASDGPAEHDEHARAREAPPAPHSEHEGHAAPQPETADPPPEAFAGPEHAADA